MLNITNFKPLPIQKQQTDLFYHISAINLLLKHNNCSTETNKDSSFLPITTRFIQITRQVYYEASST